MAAVLKLDNIQDSSGAAAIDISKLSSTSSRYTRKIVQLIDTTDRTSGTTWTLGTTFADSGDFRAGSLLRIYYMYPCRNDSGGWGGLYFEPQIRFNSGAWQSLGSRGYDAVMEYGQSINSTQNIMLIDPGQSSTFTVGIRYYFRSYDGTVGLVNALGHEINVISGTATLMSGVNGNQHYGQFQIEELALMRGSS
jgi:hypothetical protein